MMAHYKTELWLNRTGQVAQSLQDYSEMMLATYKNGKEKFEKVVKALVTNQNSNAQVTSVLHVLNDCDAVGDMHFIEDRDYFMKIAKRMEKELEV